MAMFITTFVFMTDENGYISILYSCSFDVKSRKHGLNALFRSLSKKKVLDTQNSHMMTIFFFLFSPSWLPVPGKVDLKHKILNISHLGVSLLFYISI